MFDNLYISEGSYVALSDDAENIPEPKEVVGPGEVSFRRVAVDEAEDELGTIVGRLPGTTVRHIFLHCIASRASRALTGLYSSSSTTRLGQVSQPLYADVGSVDCGYPTIGLACRWLYE